MVRLSYQNIAESYREVKEAATGQACSVMIMVAYEVDAMSSCKMLTQLLRSDHIAYNIRPVLNFDEVIYNFQSFITDDIKSIFMINCGALYNIPKIFDLEAGGDFRVFILDNHRPLHLANVYSKHSVVVFDDMFDPNEDYDNYSLPSEGSDLSGAVSSSDSEGSSSEGEDEKDEEDMFEEDELQTEDIAAAFGQDVEEDAEMDDEDNEEKDENNENEEEGENENEDGDDEAEEVNEGEEEGEEGEENSDSEGESIHTTSTRSSEASNLSDPDADPAQSRADKRGSGSGKRKLKQGKGSAKRTATTSSASISGGGKKGRVAQSAVDGDDENEAGEGEEVEEEEDEEALLRGEGDGVDEDDDNEEEEEEVRIRGRKRRTAEAEEAYRQKERRRVLQSYYQTNATFTAPTALMLIELLSAQLGSRQMPTDVVWQAVLGVTYQYTAGRLVEGLYRDYCDFLKTQFGDALRTGTDRNTFTVRAGEDASVAAPDAPPSADDEQMTVQGSESGNVEEAAEYRFFLYRHWSLYDAMFHSPYVAAKLNVWNPQGTAKLQELLARIGVSLLECKQAYQYMKPELRMHFISRMNDEKLLRDYNLVNPGATFKSFYRYNGYKNAVSASDIVHAVTALTELYGVTSHSSASVVSDDPAPITTTTTSTTTNPTTTKVTSIEAFNTAYTCLDISQHETLHRGVQAALDLQRTIVKKASAMLDGHSSIHRSRRLYYAYLNRTSGSGGAPGGRGSSGTGATANNSNSTGADIEHSFGRPMVVAKLGQYIMDIKRNQSKQQDGWTGSMLLPFILFSEKSDGTFLVVGISPLSSVSGGEALTEEQERLMQPLTNFRQFFKLAAKLLGATVRNTSFDANVVEVRKEDVEGFLGALDDSLQKATPRHVK